MGTGPAKFKHDPLWQGTEQDNNNGSYIKTIPVKGGHNFSVVVIDAAPRPGTVVPRLNLAVFFACDAVPG